MKAVNTYLVVDKIKEPEKTVKGLLLTENTDEDNRYNRGKVISVGNLVEGISDGDIVQYDNCLLYTSPSPRDATLSRMPSSA